MLAKFIFALVSVGATAVTVLAAPPYQRGSETQVVAEINGTRISRAQLERELELQLRPELRIIETDGEHYLRRRVLNVMVERELLLQVARANNYAPSESEVEATISRGVPASRSSFSEELLALGLSEEVYREQLAEDLTIERYLEEVVFSTVSVGEKELLAEFNSSPATFVTPSEVRLRHILLAIPKSATATEIDKIQLKARELLERARAEPSNFAALAKQFSNAPNASKGGDLGFLTRNQLTELTSPTFDLEVGAIAGLIRSSFGFHIVRVEDKRNAEPSSFADVRDKVYAFVLREKRKEALNQHLALLKKINKVIVYYY